MREISNRICIVPSGSLSGYLTPDLCTAAPCGSTDIICLGKVTVDQSEEDDVDGRRWTVSLSAATADPTVRGMDGTRAAIGVYLTDGQVRMLASPGRLPVISVTPYGRGRWAISAEITLLRPLEL